MLSACNASFPTPEPTIAIDPTPTREALYRCDGSPHDAVVLGVVSNNRCLAGEPIVNEEPLPDADGIVRRFQYYPPGYGLIMKPTRGVPYLEPGDNEYRWVIFGVSGEFGLYDDFQLIETPGCYLLKWEGVVNARGDDVEFDNFEFRLRVENASTGATLGNARLGLDRLKGINDMIVPFRITEPNTGVRSQVTFNIVYGDQVEGDSDIIYDTYEYLRVPDGYCG
jgi:hypothetical protein